ncbi:MAG: Gfo/Idh/MocA family oxidoreductase [Acidimicrobiales bacterium]
MTMLTRSLDGLSDDDLDELTGRIRGGERVFVELRPGDRAAALLAGAEAVEVEPLTEWFITLADRPEAARLEREVPLHSGLRHLRPIDGEVQIVATCSVRFEHRPVLTVRRLGDGVVVGSGLDATAARAHPVIGHFIDRLLAGRDEPTIATLGVAVVGYGPFGGMGYTHGLACTETEGLELVAAVDTSPERLDAARADFPDLRGYDDAKSMAADDGVDVAIIATPPVFHAPLALDLLRAGKHVVLEKPMCLTLAQADELLSMADAAGKTLTVHQSRRWDRDYLALTRAIDQGQIGEVFNIETFVGGFEHPCRAWHSKPPSPVAPSTTGARTTSTGSCSGTAQRLAG